MVGYVYEADQNAIKKAQEKLDDLRHKELINKIDDAIEAIEKNKEDDNVYNYEGTEIVKDVNSVTGDFSSLYDIIEDSIDISGQLVNALAAQANPLIASSMIANAGTTNISIGDINLTGVETVDDLAAAIVRDLPSNILQRLYATR